MATTAQPFSIEAFRELFRSSRAMKYLSFMEVEQVRQAMEKKNENVLKPLYEILLKEKSSDEEIVRDFVIAQGRIMDDFVIETKDIQKKYFEEPQKKKVAQEEAQEKAAAEQMLGTFIKKNK